MEDFALNLDFNWLDANYGYLTDGEKHLLSICQKQQDYINGFYQQLNPVAEDKGDAPRTLHELGQSILAAERSILTWVEDESLPNDAVAKGVDELWRRWQAMKEAFTALAKAYQESDQ